MKTITHLLFLNTLLFAATAFGQSTIKGKVLDEKGKGLPMYPCKAPTTEQVLMQKAYSNLKPLQKAARASLARLLATKRIIRK